ncbi:2-hydroxyacid dehydrogenase [Azospirillum argentinense]|uniref:2-hydroxyacid dehydrogenase n=1 Tax=Azospirillum argentinense TaxID=2970906 RepID=A0A060DHN9_9PROT|nr:FAD-binding oxidoreductase [Azospirillum argentinense]AIB12285.1 2-hydroxyacid dehydrogenase [Azospirillum argentinense]EZQ09119.1 2-hydroxyacid dehydrogenase [Azospirillum argentinense]
MTSASPASSPDAASLAAALDRIRTIVGPNGLLTAPEDMAPYLSEWRGRFKGNSPAVVRPASTEEVAAVVKICAEAGIPVVPQGGNTSLVGGSIPYEEGREIVISLSRMNKIRGIDTLNYTMTVEAGVVLKTAQEAAKDKDRLLPMSLGAEGTCQIGGLISTNAGGINVLRYGNMRDLVLGLEVVLADGRVWNGLRSLRKNNTGYDLKHLFIGAEGTLGIVTAAVLKLYPRPRQAETAFIAVPSPAAAIELLARLREASGDAVAAFELMSRRCLEFALKHVAGTIDPLAEPSPWYVLTELTAGTQSDAFRETVEAALGEAFEAELATDATIAQSETQANQLWFIREAIVEAQKFEGGSIKNDVSVPVSRVAEFIERAEAAVAAACPGIRPTPFGHVGDGNIHFNLSQPEGADTAAYLARWDEICHVVNEVIFDLDGSISAEHGVGRFKKDEMPVIKSPVEFDLLRAMKAALDPKGLLNPGKMLP